LSRYLRCARYTVLWLVYASGIRSYRMCSEGAPAFRPGVNRMSAEQDRVAESSCDSAYHQHTIGSHGQVLDCET
jgi:hypothetical protein